MKDYSRSQGVEIVPKKKLNKEITKKAQEIVKVELEKKTQEITSKITSDIAEQAKLEKVFNQNEAARFRIPWGFNQWVNSDRKMGSDIPFSYLRRMATLYPIARACINYRIRQLTKADWDITVNDEIGDEKGYESQIKAAREFFKHPGDGLKFRELVTIIVDDLLVTDALAFEYQRDRAGRLLGVVPVDPTTIVLRVTEQGGTPPPPDIAYAQYIKGKKIAEFTTDELFYGMMNKKSYSPYGLAPLESLILQAESALRGTMYNLNYFRESNVPEGFLTLPEDVATTPEVVQQWQQWFDDMLSGDSRGVHRLKILPGGATYTPAKKPEDMAFERFEMWLLQQTCAVFEVPPQEIGVTYQVNKATGQTQQDSGTVKGLYPLANYVRELLNEWLTEKLGFENLQFVWVDLNPVDRKEEAEIAQIEINMGALSVDEYRVEHGREAIGLGPYVRTGVGVSLVSDLLNAPVTDKPLAGDPANQGDPAPESGDTIEENKPTGNNPDNNEAPKAKVKVLDENDLEQQDIKRWRKCVYADLEKGRELRINFKSDFIKKETYDLIQEGLKGVTNKFQAKIYFDQFLDPEIKASLRLLKASEDMRRFENAEYVE